MPCTWRTPEPWLLPILTVFLVLECIYAGVGSSVTPKNLMQQQMASTVESEKFTSEPPIEVNTSLSLLMYTKTLLHCPCITAVPVVVTWIIKLGDKLPCVKAYKADANETYEKDCMDERISWDSRPEQNSDLRINPLDITHEGYYSCDVATSDGHFSHSYHLQVFVPPKVTLFQGSNGTIVCRAAAGKPAAQILWTPGGGCHTVEQQLSNGTVTVQSTCRWKGRQMSNVSCSVFHVTGNKSLSLEPGEQSPPNLTLLYVISSLLVGLIIVGSIWLWKIRCCRKCKLIKPEVTSVVEEEEMQPYASYTEKNNPLYDTVNK